jgi:hypothetical protein
MLNASKFSVANEAAKESKYLSHVEVPKGFFATNKATDEVTAENFTIRPIVADTFGYKFEVLKDGKRFDKFYKLANAKKAVVEELGY